MGRERNDRKHGLMDIQLILSFTDDLDNSDTLNLPIGRTSKNARLYFGRHWKRPTCHQFPFSETEIVSLRRWVVSYYRGNGLIVGILRGERG